MSYLKALQRKSKLVDIAEKWVSKIYKIDRKTIRQSSKDRRNTQARYAVWYILTHRNGLSSLDIAKEYRMHYSTVLRGVSMAKKLGIPKELGLQ